MRRADKEIVEEERILAILDAAPVMRLAMVDGQSPYVVPVNFARDGRDLWVHCAAEGRKLRCLSANRSVCIEVDRLIRVTNGPDACGDWTCHYESVIGSGSADVVEDEEQRLRGLRALMRKYSGRDDWQFKPGALATTTVVRIRLDSVTGKQSPPQDR